MEVVVVGGERISGLDPTHVQTNSGGEFSGVCVSTGKPLSALLPTRDVYIHSESLRQTRAELTRLRTDIVQESGWLFRRSGTRLIVSVCRPPFCSKTKSGAEHDNTRPSFL